MKTFTFLFCLICILPICNAQYNESTIIPNAIVYTSLKEALRNPKKVVNLRLRDQELKEIPSAILSMKNLETLDLVGNQIKEITEESLWGLSKLRYINLSENQVQKIHPHAFLRCYDLVELDLGNNRIDNVEFLTKLKYLSTLYLNNNKIKNFDLPKLKMRYLKFFRADANLLTEIPNFLQHSTKLKLLNLYDNQIENLNLAQFSINQLFYLNVGNNPLQSINSIVRLKALETLILDWIDLGKMESELNTITQLEQLQILSLENCNISQLPENIGQLQKLKEASFIANQIKQLPPSFYELKQLEKLWLLQNPLYLVVESQLKSGLPNCEIKL